jgi:transposase-like protein
MAKSTNPFRYFDSSPEVIRLVVMMYVRYPLSLRNVEDLLFERGIDNYASNLKAGDSTPRNVVNRSGRF